MRAAATVPTSTTPTRRRRRVGGLVALLAAVAAVMAIVPVALADTGTPINGSIKIDVVHLDNTPNGPVTVYARGQWNWQTHTTDCNYDRAGAGVGMIWNDPNEPGYAVSGKDVNGKPITFGVGVAKILNNDQYNGIDGTVHPADIGLEGGDNANPPQSGAQGQVWQDVTPVASGKPQDYKDWRGGCGREPLNGPQYPGEPYGSWGYHVSDGTGVGFSHTYLHLSDVTTVCVNMYDVHGGGKAGTKSFQVPAGNNEIDVAKAGDNTIKAGQFDPVGLNCVTPPADLAVTKDDGTTSVVAGDPTPTTYTVTVTNLGPTTATQTVTDNAPLGETFGTWRASPSAKATVSPAGGSGNVSATVTVPAGESVTFTIPASVSISAPSSLTNCASVSPAPGEPNTDNNTACDTDSVTPPPPRPFDLGVTITDDQQPVIDLTQGAVTVTYTIVVANTGPNDAPAATFTDTETGQGNPVSQISWWAVASSPSVVLGNASGTGAPTTSVTLPAGTSVTFTVTVPSPFTSAPVVNTATVDTLPGDTDAGNNSATDSHSTFSGL